MRPQLNSATLCGAAQMTAYVPSQVCEFLDERIPAARAQFKGGGANFDLPPDYAGALGHLVVMLECIPAHLLVLKAKAAAELGEATEAIRAVLAMWHAGNRSVSLVPLVGKNGWNPVTFVRRHLDGLPDEGPGTRSADLGFVADQTLRDSLAADILSVDSLVDSGAWKAATVLAGSVAEALLLDALLQTESEALNAGANLKKPPRRDIREWHLFELIEVARALQIVDESTASQCALAKDFRNFIHPGRSLRLAQVCDRGTAFAGVAAVEHVIRDLKRRAG